MKKLNLLSKTLRTFGLAKEAQSILNLTKIAFINAARIEVDVTSEKISAILVGDLPSGSTHFGNCQAMNLTNYYSVRLASSPSSSIWEFHRNIRDPEYSGLGYMNDLLITVISQIQNNGGVAFNGIGGEIMGSTVSKYGKSHTLEKLNKSLTRTPVIVFYQPKKKYYLIFEPSDKDLAKREFLEGYGFELPDNILEDLFSTPYKTVVVNTKTNSLSHKSASYNEDDEDDSYYKYEGVNIISGFKIVATSAKTSIPVSLSFSELEDSDAKTDDLKSELEKLYQSYDKLENEYFTLFSKCFNNSFYNNKEKLFLEIIFLSGKFSYEFHSRTFFQKSKDLPPDLLDSLLEKFVQNVDMYRLSPETRSTFSLDKEKYLELKPQMHSIWVQIYNIFNQIDSREVILRRIKQDKQKEYKERTKYVGEIRNKYNY